MRKTILLYGAAMAALTGILKFIEYRFFVRDYSLEFYIGAVTVLFTAVGVWAGMKLTRKKAVITNPAFKLDGPKLQRPEESQPEALTDA
jgi:two-component system, NarL family, response regulator LiaR